MGHVFISYSREDKIAVDELVRRLELAGHNVWIDRDSILGGTQYREQIIKGVKSADVFLLILSARSSASDWVIKELNAAETAKKRILAVVMDGVKLPETMELQLGSLQAVEFGPSPETAARRILASFGANALDLAPIESRTESLIELTRARSDQILTVLRWFKRSSMDEQLMLALNERARAFYDYSGGKFKAGTSLRDMLRRLEFRMVNFGAFMLDQERMIEEQVEHGATPVARVPMKMRPDLDDEFRDETYVSLAIAHSEVYTINGREATDYLLVYVNLRPVRALTRIED